MADPSAAGDESRPSLIQKLRQIEALKAGDAWPEWMNQPGGWGAPLAKLCGDAADALEHYDLLINTPQTANWLAAVPPEAAHQIQRYGVMHDAGKSPWDWFWLIGYLAQKAAAAAAAGDIEKAKHHTVSTGAAMLNWHRNLSGETRLMRPGIAEPAASSKHAQSTP